ncbi:MAG: glutamyl/glutaminyl-tRNA synthetase [Candidatus Peregrinibacteria bacterium Greene0416_62]|nr:MAG: glutamyl/glutaminyl-tRNA synthetase [Candidatus Peregrinibacteria bacterium Greene0416_62]
MRTALFCYLVAKQTKGSFLLRIEDTDRERLVEGAIENILRTLHWAGLDPDEGVMMKNGVVTQEGTHGPYIQSERLPLYQKYAAQLLEAGKAYPCFCSPDRLDQMRKEQQEAKQAPMYDRKCLKIAKEESTRRIAAGEKHVIRLEIPRGTTVTFTDDIRGLLSFEGRTIDDQVLLKSDGFPTYHLAHVVDDHLMDTDMVIRGEEWLSSLPKHLLLFEYLGWKAPRYAHVPLLLNPDRSKLSKRQGDVAAEDYKEKGYLPEALLNFLALLGWNPGTVEEIFSLKELIDRFSIERVQKAGAVFDHEKLDWLQGQWIRKLTPEEFVARLKPFLEKDLPAALRDPELITRATLIQDRLTLLPEGPEMLRFFYEEPKVTMELLANPKQKLTPELVKEILPHVRAILESIDPHDWDRAMLEEKLRGLMETKGYKLGQVLWPLRAALTGKPYSPGAFEVAEALGKEKTIKRLNQIPS